MTESEKCDSVCRMQQFLYETHLVAEPRVQQGLEWVACGLTEVKPGLRPMWRNWRASLARIA
jgi:hypothetical protein